VGPNSVTIRTNNIAFRDFQADVFFAHAAAGQGGQGSYLLFSRPMIEIHHVKRIAPGTVRTGPCLCGPEDRFHPVSMFLVSRDVSPFVLSVTLTVVAGVALLAVGD
jgi:hypothetical protein